MKLWTKLCEWCAFFREGGGGWKEKTTEYKSAEAKEHGEEGKWKTLILKESFFFIKSSF